MGETVVRRALTWLFLLGSALALSGCINSFNVNRTSGRVVFHDTDLPIRSTVTISGRSVFTESGHFAIGLEPGTHSYTVSTLLGEYNGVLEHLEGKVVKFVVPPFSGWSRHSFNEILLWNGKTARWAIGRKIRVWIQPTDTDPRL